MGQHKCGHCGKGTFTVKGLQSHISQTVKCRQALKDRVSQIISLDKSDGLTSDAMDVDIPPLPNDSSPDTYMDDDIAMSSHTPECGVNLRCVTVEEVEDEEPGGLPKRPWVGEYPEDVAAILGEAKTAFEELLAQKKGAGVDNFAPFADREDWELASWLVQSGLSQEAIGNYLTLPIVCVLFVLHPEHVGLTAAPL